MNLSTIQKGLEQETQFNEHVSAKDRLMRNLDLASNIKSDYRKLVRPAPIKQNTHTRNKNDEKLINSNIEPRISEIANKKDKTRLINQPYNTLSEEISVNPFYKNNITKTVVLNSIFRDMTIEDSKISTSNFYLTLNYKLKNVISMTLLDICLPNNLYNISENLLNNIFYTRASGGEYIQHIIPNGNYTIEQLIIEINKIPDITLAQDPVTNILTFTYHVFEIDFSYNCTNEPQAQSLGYLLGFKKTYYSMESHPLEAEYPPKLSHSNGCKYYYVVVNDFNNNVNDFMIGNLSGSFINKNILARITSDGAADTILYKNDNLLRCRRNYFGPVNIERLHIQLLNEYGNIVDLQGYDISMAIEFNIQY